MDSKLNDLSKQRLSTCHPELANLILQVAKHFPCQVICGYRNEKEQNLAYQTGHSKSPWPSSKHNKSPSIAVDVAPIPYDPKDIRRIAMFAGFVLGVGSQLGLTLRWGGDWNSNLQMADESFPDMFHFELRTHFEMVSPAAPPQDPGVPMGH